MAQIKSIFEMPTRPCWVDGRRAIFHRWTDSARPAKPRGMEEDDEVQRFQLHNVHALVEYEDGTIARVWPNAVQFADSDALFSGLAWEEMEASRDALPYTYDQDTDDHEPAPVTIQESAIDKTEEILRRCDGCKHKNRLFDNNCLYCIGGDRYTPKEAING